MKTSRGFLVFKPLLILTLLIGGVFIFAGIGHPTGTFYQAAKDQPAPPELQFINNENIPSSKWIKSVLFNSAGEKIYTLNLENMSIDEYHRDSRLMTRTFKFKPHPATGWDYDENKPMDSFEEKPVEACFTHHDKILWVSLHNAGGIVAIRLDSLNYKANYEYPTKALTVLNSNDDRLDTLSVPFIRTGKTPKVIAKTLDSKYLLVSNWHAGTISVLSINDTLPPFAKKLRDLSVGTLPRGLYVNSLSGKAFVSIMGGNTLRVIGSKNWKIQKSIPVVHNPRHITADSSGRLFVSFNKLSQIACIDPVSGRTLFTASTAANPRTIVLSKDQKYLFVTCYGADRVQVFRIYKNSFNLKYSLICNGKPIGIDLYEDAEKLEAWVCTYEEDNLKIFTFKKNRI